MVKKRKIGKTIFLYCTGIICMFPAIVLILRSLMSPQELEAEFHLIPHSWTLINYDCLLLSNSEYYAHFWKSAVYALAIVAVGLPISMLAAYAFSCRKFKCRHTLFVIYIVIMLMPFQATIVPQYLMLSHLGMLDHMPSIILPNIFTAFGTILLTQYMEEIDVSLYEAGKLDGLGSFTMFTKLVVPLCRPAMLSYLVLIFIDSWAMIEQPMIFLQNTKLYPLALELKSMDISQLLPGSVIFSILPLLIYGISRNSLVDGIQTSSIK